MVGAGGMVGTASGVGTGGGSGTGGGVGTTTGAGGGGRAGAGGGASGSAGSVGPVGDGGVGAPIFNPGELDAPSNGGTITFQNIGLAGSFPSVRDPAVGPCDAPSAAGCCRTSFAITSNMLTPWDEDVIMTLRGPLLVKQIAVYQPTAGNTAQWQLASSWDDRTATVPSRMAFTGNGGFGGAIGTECLVNVSTDRVFGCGPGSVPYCATNSVNRYFGWQGSKMIVLLSTMPFASSGKVAGPCSTTTTGNWYNAPWIGISLGELARSGAFSACQCYSAGTSLAGDGCGQFNVFEVVNDNNSFRNFDVFSTNFFGYAGYVGEGPCGGACNATLFPAAADLVSKSTSLEAAGVVTGPGRPVGAALRRPENGYRYFIILMDVSTRTVQLAIVHPQKIPAGLAAFLPALPSFVPRSAVDAVLATRLPR
jgi:Tos1-like cell wall protein